MHHVNVLNIGKDFGLEPGGRFISDGACSGELFREKHLKVKLEELKLGEKLTIVLDDQVETYSAAFLNEAFGGMVKYGYSTAPRLLELLNFEYVNSDFDFYKDRIIYYIQIATFDSEVYKTC